MENANWAPTHGLTEPWRFTVFSGDARQRLADFLAETYKVVTSPDEYRQSKYDGIRVNPTLAPVVIAIGLKRQKSEKISELDEIQAVACAVQNMHLTAAAHGLGGFWSTNPAAISDRMRQFLDLALETGRSAYSTLVTRLEIGRTVFVGRLTKKSLATTFDSAEAISVYSERLAAPKVLRLAEVPQVRSLCC